jgi:hypothetical protein
MWFDSSSTDIHRDLVIGIPHRWIPIRAGDVLEVDWVGDNDLRGASASWGDLRSAATDKVESHEEEDDTDECKDGKYDTGNDGGGKAGAESVSGYDTAGSLRSVTNVRRNRTHIGSALLFEEKEKRQRTRHSRLPRLSHHRSLIPGREKILTQR